MNLHHQLFRCLCPAQGPISTRQDEVSRETFIACKGCGKVRRGIAEWNKANAPLPAPTPAPAEFVDHAAVTFKDFTVPIPQGGFVTTYKRWYVVCVSGSLPHLIDGMTGERVELKP